jgi:hypothetical protein
MPVPTDPRCALEELDALDQDRLPYLTPEERDQELHLLYVAVTRARQQLELNAAVRSCLIEQATVRPGCARFYTSRPTLMQRSGADYAF